MCKIEMVEGFTFDYISRSQFKNLFVFPLSLTRSLAYSSSKLFKEKIETRENEGKLKNLRSSLHLIIALGVAVFI